MTNVSRRTRCVMVFRFCVLLAIAQLVFLMIIVVIAIEIFESRHAKWLSEPDIRNAVVFQRELVYPVAGGRPWGSYVLHSIDLKTGRLREVGGFRTQFLHALVTNGKRLWAIGEPDIFETDGVTSVTHHPKPLLDSMQRSRPPWPAPFIFDGRPAWVECDLNGTLHLFALADAVLEDRGEVTFPDGGRDWKFDEESGQWALVPEPPVQGLDRRPTRRWCSHYVVPALGTHYLFQFEPNIPQISYRIGFDFPTTRSIDDPASALNPANDAVEPKGWTLVEPSTVPTKRWEWNISPTKINDTICFVIDNQIFRFRPADKSSRSSRLETVRFDKQFAPVVPDLGQDNGAFSSRLNMNLDWGVVRLVSDAETGDAYIVAATPSNEIDVFRVEDDTLVKLPFHIDGWSEPVIRYFAIASLPIAAILLIGPVLLILQANWISNQTTSALYSFGHDTAELAQLERRSVARFIDLTLLLAPLACQIGWNVLHTSGDTFLLLRAIAMTQPAVLLRNLAPPLASSLWAGIALMTFATTTGLWGFTPGKWLCHIRVVRSTLRPCGIARALLRELLLWFDAPLLLTVIPGVVALVITQNRQRIGDLLADTIVIDVGRTSHN